MSASRLLQVLRGREIEVTVENDALRLKGTESAQIDDLRPRIHEHKRELIRLLQGESGPAIPAESSHRPCLLIVAKRHRRLFGIPIIENYKLITGVDLETTNPDWEDLKKYDACLCDEEAELLPALEGCEEREARGA